MRKWGVCNCTVSMWMCCSQDNPCLFLVTPVPFGWLPVRKRGCRSPVVRYFCSCPHDWGLLVKILTSNATGKGRRSDALSFARSSQTGMDMVLSFVTGSSLWGSKRGLGILGTGHGKWKGRDILQEEQSIGQRSLEGVSVFCFQLFSCINEKNCWQGETCWLNNFVGVFHKQVWTKLVQPVR